MTVAQLRDLAPDDYEAYRALEKVVGGKYPIYPNTSWYVAIDWCNYLTKRYQQQLPTGYVFRLPTEAELEYAADVEGTASKYLDEKDGWYSSVAYDTQQAEFEKLRKKLDLDKLGKWTWDWSWWGWLERPRAFVGGRTKPHASGVSDFFMNSILVLDRYRSELELLRSHDEEDPFNWVEGPFEERKLVKISRRKLFERYHLTWNPEGVFHVVVGPDVIAEGKWRTQKEDSVVGVAPMAGKVFELATIPKKPNRAVVQDLVMENTKMTFCGIPSGKFKMTNFDNGVKKFHRVEITKPFWMSKFCVTMEQWSEFGIHDCETFGKDLRKYFPQEKYPICVSRDRYQWDVFCDYLTQKYGNRIPKGYVFRLPTEAEWEWAMIGKVNGSIEDIRLKKWDNWDEQIVGDFRKLLKRKRVPVGLKVNEDGYARGRFAGEGWHSYRYYIGGRLPSSILGVTDNIVGELMMFDTFQTDGTAWDAAVQDYIKYDESEIDPCRYDGRYAQRTLVRSGSNRKSLQFMTRIFLAHIVIGPDYGGACRLREDSLYSNEAYGGVFLGDRCKILELSSADTGDELNNSERHAALIDRSPAKFDDHINFRTKEEPSPWIDLELDKPYQLSGIRVEIIEWEHIAYPLRIWASIDRKKWIEIGADDRKLKRFEFDVSAKKIQARYIRVGRERGVKNDNFGLSKVLIYGKK